MIERFISVPFVSISPNTVTHYSRIFDTQIMDYVKPMKNIELPDDNNHKGMISKKSHSRIYKRIFTFLYATDREILFSGNNKEKVGFVTLTLPCSQIESEKQMKGGNMIKWKHTDQEIKSKCLNQLFVELKRDYDVNDRIWKAEKQFNGNIHFHILVNKYIPHEELRKKWNRIINKLGYVQEYAKKFRSMSVRDYISYRLSTCSIEYANRVGRDVLIKRYKKVYEVSKKENWLNPNTVDIHNLYKTKSGKGIKNVVAYIAKYMSKDDTGGREFGFEKSYVSGRIWYCSQFITRSCQLSVDSSDLLIKDFEEALKKIEDSKLIVDESEEQRYFCGCFCIVEAARKGIVSFDNIFRDNLEMQRKIMIEKQKIMN